MYYLNREIIFVNRGWVPYLNKELNSRPDSQVEGIVTLKGLVRKPSSPTSWTPQNNPLTNYWFWIDTETMSKTINKDCHNVIIDLTAGILIFYYYS